MGLDDLFSTATETIELRGLDSILKFTHFHPLNTSSFREGLELANDLKSDSGTTLYPKGTEVTRERIERLLKFRESNPDMEFNLMIKRSEKLIQKFREEIKERMDHLLTQRKKSKVTSALMKNIDNFFNTIVDKVLSEQNTTLALYKMRFSCELAKTKLASRYADHAMETAIFSLALATSEKYEPILGNNEEKLCQFVTAALFHNYGAVFEIDNMHDAPAKERPEMYWEAIRRGIDNLSDLELGAEILSAFKNLCDYQKGERGFIADDKSAAQPNILVVVDTFLQKESGLFGDSLDAKHVVDKMNIQVREKQLNELAVQALTLGLNLTDIFDFYAELDRLVKKCPYDSAVAYPLTGLYTPSIFICKKTVTKCPLLELSVKAVNLVQPLGELSPGEYHRCKLLTPKLSAFYEDHYVEIKESTVDKAKAEGKLKEATPVKGEEPKESVKKEEAVEEGEKEEAVEEGKKEEAVQEEKKEEAKSEEKPANS